MKKLLFPFLLLSGLLFIPFSIKARDASQINDWYIKDFQSEITVNKDSSLLIKETILADCGNLPDKHGIFRIVPTYCNLTESKKVKTPVLLESITDKAGHKLQYSAENNYTQKTIRWKIGDPNKTVQGENTFIITYLVKNTIRFGNNDFDEFYWNLNGNFWNIPTDHFIAKINFPKDINSVNAKIYAYSGFLGDNSNQLASYHWTDSSTLQVESIKTLEPKQGITVSASFPKNIISPYKPSFREKYGAYFFVLIPLFVFIFGLQMWKRFGKDFKLGRTVMAEYDIPNGLKPLELGMLHSNGNLLTNFVTASIINLAVTGHMKIEQLEKTWILGGKDFALIKQESKILLSDTEQKIFDSIFFGRESIKLSELKKSFYTKIPEIKKVGLKFLIDKKYFEPSGFLWRNIIVVSGIVFAGLGVASFGLSIPLGITLISSGVILFIFGLLMPRRTKMGAEIYWKTEGFKLFIKMTEQYRQQFNEKENIFEKLLPYAMIFGLTKIWINNIKKIYGENYFNTYHPVWFYGANAANFNEDSFNSAINSLSTAMNSAVSPSGGGGAGSAGGGGGGGGGGGW